MFRTFRPLAAFVAMTAIVALSAPATAQKPFDDPVLERMRKDVFFLASPECEGRGIETKGIEKAADYVVQAFQKAGVKPAMKDGTYFQPFTVSLAPSLDRPTSFTLTGPDGAKKEPELLTEYTPLGFSRTSKAKGGLVFAGFGVSAPALKYDDYEGLDVEGKIVVMLRRAPRYGVKGEKRFDTKAPDGADSPHAAFAAKIELAAKKKAAGVVIVNDLSAAGQTDPLPRFADYAAGGVPAKFPVLIMKRDLFDTILKADKRKPVGEIEAAINESLKPQSFELKGWTADAVVTTVQKEVKCKNVVGVLDGAGPLKDETVVIGAHYDHVGYGLWGSAGGEPAKGKVHYGADDNASGTTVLMELARRYGSQKDRQGRRLVFVAFSAEEHGLDGSKHDCTEPPFPLDKTAAMINMDMVGRTKPVNADYFGLFGKKDRLLVYGTGTGEGFDKLVDAVSQKVEFKVTTLAAGTGPSDHDSFYRKGVPVLFLYTGIHPEYHKPTDVPEKIDVPGMKKVAAFAELLANDALARETKPKYVVVREPHSDPTDPTPRGPSGPRLGIAPGNYGADNGVLVDAVSPGGVAEKAGVQSGDFIVEIAGKPTPTIQAYMTAMGGQKPGDTIDVVVERKGKKLTLKAELK